MTQIAVSELGMAEEIDNGTIRNLDPTFLFDFFTRHKYILHRLATLHIINHEFTNVYYETSIFLVILCVDLLAQCHMSCTSPTP